MHLQDAEKTLAEPDWAAFIALDWGDQKHDWAMAVPGVNIRERGQGDEKSHLAIWSSRILRKTSISKRWAPFTSRP
jgi:hypothetical protein